MEANDGQENICLHNADGIHLTFMIVKNIENRDLRIAWSTIDCEYITAGEHKGPGYFAFGQGYSLLMHSGCLSWGSSDPHCTRC